MYIQIITVPGCGLVKAVDLNNRGKWSDNRTGYTGRFRVLIGIGLLGGNDGTGHVRLQNSKIKLASLSCYITSHKREKT